MPDIKKYLPYPSNPVIPDRDIYVIISCIMVALFMASIIIGFFIWLTAPFVLNQLEGKLYSYLPRDNISKAELIEEYEEGDDYILIDLRYNNEKFLKTSIYMGRRELKDWDELYQEVCVQWKRQLNSGAQPFPFTISADDDVPMQAVINAINACKRAGVTTVELVR